ncbi:MAG TPA: site-specific DNA-methyltransferase [Anaerolineae bacterium]|nr:site-specific DNA-methyltransferase [Anaerolineae bacterium]
MAEVAGGSVQLVVTSPPYNVGKAYATHSDNLPLDEYLAFLNQVWRECYRVLAPGGRLCINVANTDRKPYLPLNALLTAELLRMARDEGLCWQMRGEIIWDKHSSAGVSTAWGSFASSTDPVLRDVHEYIMVFSKEQFRLDDGGKTGISGGQFVDWTRSIWRPEEQESVKREPWLAGSEDRRAWSVEREVGPAGAEDQATEGSERAGRSLEALQRKLAGKLKDARNRSKDDEWIAESLARAAWQYFSEPGEGIWAMTTESGVDHPAPFPVELPRRLILLYTQPGDLVLDPFMGAGATAVAAVQTDRHYAGYDVSEDYCALARRRVEASRHVDK